MYCTKDDNAKTVSWWRGINGWWTFNDNVYMQLTISKYIDTQPLILWITSVHEFKDMANIFILWKNLVRRGHSTVTLTVFIAQPDGQSKVLRPTRHKIGHFGHVLPLARYWKTKANKTNTKPKWSRLTQKHTKIQTKPLPTNNAQKYEVNCYKIQKN